MNIETRFLTRKELFNIPNQEYRELYTTIAKSFVDNIHPEVNVKILELEKEGYYNNHGTDHIIMVIDRASKIIDTFISNDACFDLSDYESFILLLSIHLHDAGHIIGKRKEHASKVHELLSRHCGRQLTSAERRTIGDIAKAHGGKNDPIGKLVDEHISGFEIRTRLLAAILRLSDELAEDKTRASRALLAFEDDKKDSQNTHIDKNSEVFHRFSESLDSIIIQGNEIKISFCVSQQLLNRKFVKKISEGDVVELYLLDEIYERTYKTFLETLYCNRFFPSKSRFNVIKIKIDLMSEYDEVFKTISYELIEKGYPSTESLDTLINPQITIEGNVYNGTFVANLITERLYEKESIRS